MIQNRLCGMLLIFLSAMHLPDEGSKPTFFSDFSSLQGWREDSTKESPKSYEVDSKKGLLRISTRAGTKDRVKVATEQKFSAGQYTWRVYVPEMGVGDQASIGAFLYQDDKREVDFEIGYGTSKLRNQLDAKEDDLVCYFTSQGFPYSSSQALLKREKWYTCSIRISYGENDNFLIEWFLNNVKMKTLQTEFSDETTFTAHCSLENLQFLGDHLPTQENYALFDYFKFTETSKK